MSDLLTDVQRVTLAAADSAGRIRTPVPGVRRSVQWKILQALERKGYAIRDREGWLRTDRGRKALGFYVQQQWRR